MANRYNITFDTEADYLAYKASSAYCEPNVSYISNDNIVHFNPYDPYAGHEYVEIGGLKWATMNVGANSVTDTGLYFQWGDTQGYTADQIGDGEGLKYFGWPDYKYGNIINQWGETSMTKYNATDGKTVLDIEDDAARANMGGQWRMPTFEEYVALGNAVNTAWTNDYQGSGTAGLVCTDKTDSSKVLFFPDTNFAGDGNMSYMWSNMSIYYSSSLNNDINMIDSAYCLSFNNEGGINWGDTMTRYYGCHVRGVLA